MEQYIQKNQELKPFLVDMVITPFLNYMVIDYKDPYVQKHPERAGGVLDFSGEYVFGLSPQRKDLESLIFGFLQQHPDLEINGEKVVHTLDMPSGKLSYIFSQELIRKIGSNYRKRQIKLSKKPQVHIDIFSIEQSERYVINLFTWGAWEQLVRKASKNHLQFGDSPPYMLTMDEKDRGFSIIGGGMDGNCGYGTTNIFFYSMLDNGIAEASENGLFQVKTIQAEPLLSTTINRIAVGFLTPEQFKGLTQRGIVIDFGGWPAFTKLDNPMTDKLKERYFGLKPLQLKENNVQTP